MYKKGFVATEKDASFKSFEMPMVMPMNEMRRNDEAIKNECLYTKNKIDSKMHQ